MGRAASSAGFRRRRDAVAGKSALGERKPQPQTVLPRGKLNVLNTAVVCLQAGSGFSNERDPKLNPDRHRNLSF